MTLPQAIPLISHGWIAPLLEQRVHAPDRWFVFLAWEGDDLVGVLPVVAESKRVFVPSGYIIEEGDVCLAVGREQEVLAALLRALLTRVRRPSRAELGGVREGSPTLTALEAGVPGWAVTRGPSNLGSALVVEGGLEAVRERLSKSQKRDLKRGQNKIKREFEHSTRFEFRSGADAKPELLEPLIQIEMTGWKGKEGGAIGSDPSRRARYEAMTQHFFEAGLLEWHFLYLGEDLAAAHMAIRWGTSLMMLRQVYNEAYRKHGVGNVLLMAAAERECERGDTHDINLVNDYPWCRRWGMERTRYHRFHLLRTRPWPLLTTGWPYLARAIVRRVPGLKAFLQRRRASDS